MCPILRGEALPLPANELRDLRERLPRAYADAVVPTAAGPLLVVRVPHREPDFLRDLEAAVEVMPYRDLHGFRGVLLLGDRAHMGVSCDMLRALLEGREQAERDWVAAERRRLDPWTFSVGRMPSDPKRTLRAVFRTDTESVEDLGDPDFDRLADMLPEVKAASPGQTRPAYAYVVAEGDHVALDGAAFFSELERRRRGRIERDERRRRQEIDEKHDLAIAHLDRIMEERARRKATERPDLGDLGLPPPPVDVPRGEDPARRTPAGAPGRPSASLAPAVDALPPVDVVRPERDRTDTHTAPPVDGRFRDADRHPEAFAMIRQALLGAGYRVKERLVVRDRPIAIAGARLEGYPTRVLVAFHEHLTPDIAHALLMTGRAVGAELVLVVADRVAEGVDRVTLATNLKVVQPDAVPDLRFR